MKRWLGRVVGLLLVASVVLGLVWAFRPSPVLVDLGTVARGELVVTADDDGGTRVRERYVIHAPIRGRLLRTPLEPGDPVVAGSPVVAEFVPATPDPLDERSHAEAEARQQRAAAAAREAQARQDEMQAEHAFAQAELARTEQLVAEGGSPTRSLEQARRDERRAREALRAAEFGVKVALYEQEIAAASLREIGGFERPDAEHNESSLAAEVPTGRLRLRSPIDGRVLRVFEESTRSLAPGTPILEVGDTGQLEVVADYLSQAAVRVLPGMRVQVFGFGGVSEDGAETVLEGRVRTVEPGGYTKVSALGVEEQRVDIVVDPAGDLAGWRALGDGFRVELAVELWRGDDVLTVPSGALFGHGEDQAVFSVVEGEAQLVRVRLGRRNPLQAEVLDGLAEGDTVVLYPTELLGDGTRVQSRLAAR